MDSKLIEEIKSLWFSGLGGKSIKKKLDLECSDITINRLAKKNNWIRNSNQKIAQKLIEANKDEIFKLFDTGVQASDIATRLNLNHVNLLRFLRRNGREPKKLHYKFNDKRSVKEQRSLTMKKLLTNTEFKIKNVNKLINSTHDRSLSASKPWLNDAYKIKMSEIARKRWYKYETWKKMKCFKNTKPEVAIASILNDFDIKHERNFQIGKYNIDFYFKDLNLFLDVDGEYWHGRFNNDHAQVQYVVDKDQRKTEFFKSTGYNYIRLWEEYTLSKEALFKSLCKIIDLSKTVDYDFQDVKFKNIDYNIANEMLGKYHYIGGCAQSSKLFGAYHNDVLIGVCTFAKPQYNNKTNDDFMELTRFCIHPIYQKKNAASFMLAKFIKLSGYDAIITYADSTQGHDGIIYKASGFTKIGNTQKSYHYIDENGGRYHKKTIWNHAKKMKMTENQYVQNTGLRKIDEDIKYKFVLIKKSI